jgi:transcription initiation factor TFIIIB Brf1 subunit/transcription initiation factor TFIIB
MVFPTTASSSSISHSSNGPDCPPVLYNPYGAGLDYDEDEDRCRSCQSTSLHTDWKQGDRVCTNCGVVSEGSLRDDRPEWKEFAEAEDLAKGLPAGARSGMVAVDESKYLGGLQPTSLSKHSFGGEMGGYDDQRVRKRLRATNRKLDHMMDKIHHKAVKDAKVERNVMRRKQVYEHEHHQDDSSIRPEYDQLLLQEEEDAHRMQAALYAEKWSLQRSIRLFGSGHGHEQMNEEDPDSSEGRDDLLGRMDGTLRKASQDLYKAYSMLLEAAQKLHLPDRVINEAANRLVQYVTRRDGFCVKGVSSRLSKSQGSETPAQLKQAAERLRDYNKLKQIGSLGSAILFLTARHLGWTRLLQEVCASFQIEDVVEASFIKPKHCSKAMNEIKATFPDYARSHMVAAAAAVTGSTPSAASPAADATESLATANFADHSLRKLQLPPVAEASIRTLLAHCRQEQLLSGRNSGTKLATLCASVAFFVCTAGSVMQRLAQQAKAQPLSPVKTEPSEGTKKRKSSSISAPIPRKRLKCDESSEGIQENGESCSILETRDSSKCIQTDSEHDTMGSSSPPKTVSGEDDDDEDDDEEEPFDVFTHSAATEAHSENLGYEMRRMWDAWVEQMPWSRTVGEIEHSSGVSRNVVLEFYKSDLYPRREDLLRSLKEAVTKDGSNPNSLPETPLAPILLDRISTAAPLMSNRLKP